MLGIGDDSKKSEGHPVGGNLVLMANRQDSSVNVLHWKTKKISRVCHSAKEAETKNIVMLVEDSLYLARQISQIYTGEKGGQIPVRLMTDSKPLLLSIASTSQVESKSARVCIEDFKERLLYREVLDFSWLPTNLMIADILTKRRKDHLNMNKLLLENVFEEANNDDNMVKAVWTEEPVSGDVTVEMRLFNERDKEKSQLSEGSRKKKVT